jgi:hypothetical protein
VREDATERDRLRKSARNLEVEIIAHLAIEIELARLDELHHRDRREEL